MTTRHPNVVGGEPRNRQLPSSGPTQGQRRAVDRRLRAGPHATEGPSESLMSGSAGRGSWASALLRTRAALALLQGPQRTTSGPDSGRQRRPRPCGRLGGWRPGGRGGGRGTPGHQSPTVARCSATARRRRWISALRLRSGRRARLAWSRAWSWVRLQSLHLGLPRTCLPQPRQGRSRDRVIGVCGACAGAARGRSWGSGRPTRRAGRSGRGNGEDRAWRMPARCRTTCLYPRPRQR
jgi:hypothetical protein